MIVRNLVVVLESTSKLQCVWVNTNKSCEKSLLILCLRDGVIFLRIFGRKGGGILLRNLFKSY